MIFWIDVNRLQPLFLQPNQQHGKNDQGPFIENCIGISPRNWSKKKLEYFKFWFICFFSRLVPVTKANDLAQVYDEKLRLLRKLKPELFDNQGNLLSHNPARTHSYTTTSAPSSKK